MNTDKIGISSETKTNKQQQNLENDRVRVSWDLRRHLHQYSACGSELSPRKPHEKAK